MNQYKQILKLIKKYDEIVIARHTGPDPDALASEIALREIIKLNFPNKKVYAVGTSVARFKYIGLLDKVKYDELTNPLLIICDVPSFDRVDDVDFTKFNTIIKIDHHPYSNKECIVDLVDESSSSTCEILADMVYSLKLKLNKNIAEVLFIGIASDSERFLLSYTNPRTFNVCSHILNDFNIDLTNIYNNLYERPLNEKKFESYIINNMTITDSGFGYMKLTNDILKKFNVDPGTPSNMVNDFNFIKGLKAWAFATFDEKIGMFRVNIRSRNVVINDVAEKFNGGGHKFAAGARLKEVEQVDHLFEALDNRCKEE